jgi:hypothetical protein
MDRKTRGGGTGRRARKIVNEQEKPAIAIQQRESEVVRAAAERLCGLALDTFARVQAVLASCLVPMPYGAARAAMGFQQRGEGRTHASGAGGPDNACRFCRGTP